MDSMGHGGIIFIAEVEKSGVCRYISILRVEHTRETMTIG